MFVTIALFLKFCWEIVNFWNISDPGQTGYNSSVTFDPLTLDPFRVQELRNSILSNNGSDVVFYLYPDRRNLSYTEILDLGNKNSVLKSHYKVDLPLILLTHGFVTNYSDGSVQQLKNAYLETKYPANIVGIDWGNLSTPTGPAPYLYYPLAVANVPIVAQRIADFIQFLINIKAVQNPSRIQFIGHSLGAHIAGLTGKRINSTLGKPLGRISGLDPAAPEFQTNPPEKRLDKSDATFVDVYHTNQGFKGYLGRLGHVDFFPNGGGPFQPDCSNATDFSDIFTGVCSHARAYVYFAKSIRNSTIKACKCNTNSSPSVKDFELFPDNNRNLVPEDCKSNCMDPIVFGQFCPLSARGTYYLQISA